MTEDQFIIGIKQQDQQIEAAFYKLFYKMVEKLVIHHDGSYEDAKNVYQDSIMEMFEKIRTGKHQKTTSLQTQLLSIAYNKWNFYNNQKRGLQNRNNEELHYLTSEESDNTNHKERKHQKVEEALEMINITGAKIIYAYYLEKMSLRNMAKRFGYEDENSMKRRIIDYMTTVRNNLMLIDQKLQVNEKV